MSRPSAPRTLILLLVAAVLVVNAAVFHQRLTEWISGMTGTVIAPIDARLAWLRAVAAGALSRDDLARRNEDLANENAVLRWQLADQEQLRRDVAFYREAAGITARGALPPVEAGVITNGDAGGVRQVVLNRGSDDWVMTGDVVATSAGVLVGSVIRVFPDHSVIRAIGDAQFEVAARVSGTDITGLVRTGSDGTVILDLVQKDEMLGEGAQLVTSGDDRFPAGLIIGTVRSVDNEAATLFQVIRVNPGISERPDSRVLVIRP